MATKIEMPQMGESVAEGTIVRWLKSVGDSVDRDEPIEITTDKVDAEIPAPRAVFCLRSRFKRVKPWKSAQSWPSSAQRVKCPLPPIPRQQLLSLRKQQLTPQRHSRRLPDGVKLGHECGKCAG